MEDEQIIELYFQRSEEALSATAREYEAYCFSIAQGILQNREDAREAVNDTYLAAWNAIPPHRPRHLDAFLGKITRRIAINRWQASRAARRGGGEIPLALDELSGCIPGGQTVQEALENAELGRVLNDFVHTLPETERRVFIRRYWYLDPIRMIAKRYGFSQSKVKSMLLRTRSRLRRVLEKEEIDL